MNDIATMDAITIISEAVLDEVFDERSKIKRASLIIALQERAKALGIKSKFDAMLKAYNDEEKEIERNQRKKNSQQEIQINSTEFGYFKDGHELICGTWKADFAGVRNFDMWGEHIACYHPILITKRLLNAETDKEKVRIAFCKGYKWREITVDKGMIASSNKIVNLADYGVSVTSESAKLLVKFLSELEFYNMDTIECITSTSKFGWIGDEFMPYGGDIEFDGESRFKDLYESLKAKGDYDVWLNLAREIRKSNRYEPQLYMAGAFASILVKPLNVLPFILNLWGETGKGKTVALMLATSIWANPAENKYITDSVGTQNAFEAKENALNNLPMVIDDLSKVKEKYGDGFADFVYMICGGIGKSRSNIMHGLEASSSWANVCLTNIERPLASDTMRGGAINRILDFEMDEGSIFKNGNKVVQIINQNYGFAGQLFVDIVKSIGFEAIREMQEEYLARINARDKELGVEKEEKQAIPLSVLMVADRLATDAIFQDGIYLDFNRCVDALKNKGEVSENDRAYEFILSEIAINSNKFVPDDDGNYRGECWGKIEDGYSIIISSAFDRICEKGNFSRKGFLQWAGKRELIKPDNQGKPTRTCRFGDTSPKCVWLKIPTDGTDSDGFMIVDKDEKLPFD